MAPTPTDQPLGAPLPPVLPPRGDCRRRPDMPASLAPSLSTCHSATSGAGRIRRGAEGRSRASIRATPASNAHWPAPASSDPIARPQQHRKVEIARRGQSPSRGRGCRAPRSGFRRGSPDRRAPPPSPAPCRRRRSRADNPDALRGGRLAGSARLNTPARVAFNPRRADAAACAAAAIGPATRMKKSVAMPDAAHDEGERGRCGDRRH